MNRHETTQQKPNKGGKKKIRWHYCHEKAGLNFYDNIEHLFLFKLFECVDSMRKETTNC